METKNLRRVLFDYGIPCAAAIGVGLMAYVLTGGKEEYQPALNQTRGDDLEQEECEDDCQIDSFSQSNMNSTSRSNRKNRYIDEILAKFDEQMAVFSQSSLDVIKKIDDAVVYNPPPWAVELLKKSDQLDLELKQVKQMMLRQQQQQSENGGNHIVERPPNINTSTPLHGSTTSTTTSAPNTPSMSTLVKRQSIGTDPTIPLPLSHYIRQLQAAMMCLALQIEDVEPSSEDYLRRWIEKLETGNDPSGIDAKKMTSASETMTLFIKTLLKQPEVPRYRKIAATNFAFKNSLAGLLGIDRLFTATGFTLRGNYWEWDWYVPSDMTTSPVSGVSNSSLTPSKTGKIGPPPPCREEWSHILQLAVDSLAFLKANQKIEMLRSFLPGASSRRPSMNLSSQSMDSSSAVQMSNKNDTSAIKQSTMHEEIPTTSSTSRDHLLKLQHKSSQGIAITDSPYGTVGGVSEPGISLIPSRDREDSIDAPPAYLNSGTIVDASFASGLSSSGPGPLRFEDIFKTVQGATDNT